MFVPFDVMIPVLIEMLYFIPKNGVVTCEIPIQGAPLLIGLSKVLMEINFLSAIYDSEAAPFILIVAASALELPQIACAIDWPECFRR